VAPPPPAAVHPPPSPLSGGYLLVIVGEPHCVEHKEVILHRIAQGNLTPYAKFPIL